MKKSFFLQPRMIQSVVIAILIVLSFTICAPAASNPGTYPHTIKIIDENRVQAMSIATVITASSTAMSSLGEDTGSAIADQLANLSVPLVLIMCALFCEKFLLTSLGAIAWGVLFPLGGLACIVALWSRHHHWRLLAKKILLIGLLCAFIIPVSAWFTHMIEDTLSYQTDQTFAEIMRLGEIFVPDEGTEGMNAFTAFLTSLTSGVTQLISTAKDLLGLIIDAVTVLITTSFLMPLLTFCVLIWAIRSIIRNKLEDAYVTLGIVQKGLLEVKKLVNSIHPDDDEDDEDIA